MNALSALVLLAASSSPDPDPTIAFHYGTHPPLEELAVYDWVVLEPKAVGAGFADTLSPGRPIAYVAIGESNEHVQWADRTQESWVIGRNPAWKSRIMDMAAEGWTRLLLDEILPDLWDRGFRGFFFDTLDSHLAVLSSPEAVADQWAALARFLRAVRAKYPDAVLIANRGFEVLQEVDGVLDAVAAESLFAGWQEAEQHYASVSAEDRKWLQQRLGAARSRGLVTIGIDYLPPSRRAEARRVAREIRGLGHVPWVAPAELDALGVGALEVLPRRVLVLYEGGIHEDIEDTSAQQALVMPLEYLGLSPRLIDVRTELPKHRIAGEIAGVVAWLEGRPLGDPAAYRGFLTRQLEDGVPIALFGSLDPLFDDALRRRFSLERGVSKPVRDVRLSKTSALLGFEIPPRPLVFRMTPLRGIGDGFDPLLEHEGGGLVRQSILIAPWGGLALEPDFMREIADQESRWVLDPFEFLRKALQLPDVPRVDPTTENGRRLLVTHIDGDGAPSRCELPGRPLAISVIRRWVERNRFPHTVSVVEVETAHHGHHPDLSAELEREARRLFRLPHVEPASHGYLHPFDWRDFENQAAGRPVAERSEDDDPIHLHLDNAIATPEREIAGALEYVSRLTDKPVDMFLWTGTALPGPESMAVIARTGVRNMNGGMTIVTDARPSVVHVSPLGRPVDGAYQVYAPVMNENVYTNLWTGPFWGFRRVRQTFERTGFPRRLKPIGIYYHYYSATIRAGLRALEQVYEDALARNPLPVFASTWVDKVLETRRSVVGRTLDGRFLIDRIGTVRTARLPESLGRVDVSRSEGVLGVRSTPVGRFVHFDGRRRIVVAFGPEAPAPILVEANARVRSARRRDAVLELEFAGGAEGPLQVFAMVRGARCDGRTIESTEEGVRYRVNRRRLLRCDGGKSDARSDG